MENLVEKKQPMILFVWTKNAGVVWYRMIQFADAMCSECGLELGKDIFYPAWNPGNEFSHQWEREAQGNLKAASDYLAPLISDADVVVFQTLNSQIGLSFLLSCKDLQKKVLTEIDDLERRFGRR